MRFLSDECLYTSLIEIANEAGHEADHVVYRGWAGSKDHELREIILREEFVFVTNNGRDFRELLQAAELHPGLVIIVPNEKPAAQRDLFRDILDRSSLLNANKLVCFTGFLPSRRLFD